MTMGARSLLRIAGGCVCDSIELRLGGRRLLLTFVRENEFSVDLEMSFIIY
jgi:hypothetical protein